MFSLAPENLSEAPKRKRRGEARMGGGEEEEEEGCDRLSSLPEALLSSILSLVPTKQAVATSVLSKRWRHVWRSVTHVHLLHEHLFPTSDDDDRSAVGSWESMLNSVEHSVYGPVRSCRVSFDPSGCLPLRLNSFLRWLAQRGVRELAIVNRGASAGCDYELPSEVFFCATLEKLELGKCMVSVLPPPATIDQLSSIKSLVLAGVYFTNDQFRQMMDCCNSLESLKVDNCVEVRHFRIGGPKLTLLEVATQRRVQISVRDVPELRQATFRFQFAAESTRFHFWDEDGDQASKLIQLLADLSHCSLEKLSLHFSIPFAESLQQQRADCPLRFPPHYHLKSVKKLNVETSLFNLEAANLLSYLLNSCPNMHELIIQDKEHLDTRGSYWETQNPPECLINRLRIIEIHGVNTYRSYWVEFIKFLLVNACVCERITIRYAGDSCNKKLGEIIKKLVEQKLKMFQWASPHATLELKPLF